MLGIHKPNKRATYCKECDEKISILKTRDLIAPVAIFALVLVVWSAYLLMSALILFSLSLVIQIDVSFFNTALLSFVLLFGVNITRNIVAVRKRIKNDWHE